MADEEIVVEIEQDGATGATEVVKTEATEPIADLKAQYEQLQAETERERTQRVAAEQTAADATRREQAAHREVEATRSEITDTRLGTVEQGISAAQTEADAAQAEYESAQEAGNWKKAAEAQRKMSRAEAQIVRLNEAKSDLEIQKATPVVRQEPERPAPTDPTEAFLSRCDAPTAKWLRDHPEDARVLATNSDPRRAAKLRAAGADAEAEGYKPSDANYWGHVEKFLNVQKPNGKTNGNGAQTQRRSSAPVAPVAQSGGGTSGGGAVVTLSQNEKRSAEDGTLIWNYDDPSGQKRFRKGDPIGVQEFARRKLALKQSGQYDKTLTEQ